MNLHIARGDQKFGPFSLAETQDRLNSGTLFSSDLAWWKGQPGWIPLNQVPGIVAAASGRPALVWVICAIFLALVVWRLGISLWFLFHFLGSRAPSSPQVHIDYTSLVIGLIISIVEIWGFTLLFRLRRSALYVLGGTLGVSFLFTAWHMSGLLLHASYSPLLIVQLVFFTSLNLIMLAYVWHLFLKGVLR